LDGRFYSLCQVPRGTYLVLAKADAVSCPEVPLAVLVVNGKQFGCGITAGIISRQYKSSEYDGSELARKFIHNTKENRGLVLTVEYPVAKEEASQSRSGLIVPPAVIQPGCKVFLRFPTGNID